MYKVFINSKVICFTNNEENYDQFSYSLTLNFFQANITPFMLNLLNKDAKLEAIIVNVDDYEQAFVEFQSCFKLIKAAGGIVNNKDGKVLFIYRLEKWDLPKGKMEEGENDEITAIREVEEECGITGVIINKRLQDTFHIYKLKGEFVLKQTFWFDMFSDFVGKLIPQTEENITKAEWLNKQQINGVVMCNTYASIAELLISSAYL